VNCKSLDIPFLNQTWQEMNLPFLPEDFDWELIGKLYIRSVKQIITKSEKLRPIYDIQLQEKNSENLQALVGIAPDFDLGRYAEGLKEQYGNLKLESLDTTGVYYNELKLWKIFIAQNVRECQEFLPQIHELPKDQIKRLREAGEAIEILSEEELERQRHRYINQQSQLVWEVIGDPTAKPAKSPIQQVVILGDPGAGKSSLLQYIALIWAERPLRDLSLYPLPLLLELRIYARDKQASKCEDILSFIHGGNITCRLNQQQLHERLRLGQAIALFDGIDEIFDPVLREEVVTDIHRFSNDYAQVQVIITSRWLGYKAQRLRDAGFRHFMLQDLEIEQIQDFLERWHNLTFTDQVDKVRKWERLQRAIQDSKSIRELAGNPLLLTMMAILNRNQELPRDRPELYNQASRVLLHQWDVERALIEDARLDPKTIDYRDKQAMLRKVAYRMQSSEKGLAGNLISATDLEAILTDYLKTIEVEQARTVARLFINQLRTRNFILCFLGADSYGFVHRTFLEYFCAWEFVWQFKESQTLTIEQLINEVFGAHWQDESWHEVLRLICGMIEPKFVEKIIDFLLEQEIDRSAFSYEASVMYSSGSTTYLKREGMSNLLLASFCLSDIKNRNSILETSDRLLEMLKKEVKQKSNIVFDDELKDILILLIAKVWQHHSCTLIFLKDCVKMKELYNFFHNSTDRFRQSAVKEIAEGWKEDPDTLPFLKDLALYSEHFSVRRVAVEAIFQGWKEDPNTLPWLQERALKDKDNFIRQTALTAIIKNWKEDPDILPCLKIFALKDNDHSVREVAWIAILQNWKKYSDILPWLKDSALNDKASFSVEQDVLRAILQNNGEKDPETLPWLKDNALKNTDCRLSTVRTIIENWKEDPDALIFLKSCALEDENIKIRREALTAIIEDWKEDLDTLPFLKSCTLHNTNYRVQQSTMIAIIENWKKDSDTLLFLKNCALQHEDIYIRQVAVKAIAEDWKEDFNTLFFLKDCAVHNTSFTIRLVAIRVIAEDWKEESATLPWLKDRALQDENNDVRETAVNVISKGWKEDPDTLPWLKNRALQDQGMTVRRYVVWEIAEDWKEDSATLHWLKDRALQDENNNVRETAVNVISKGWKEDPDTLPWLKDRALQDEDYRVRRAVINTIIQNGQEDPELFEFGSTELVLPN
jgi:predicted NACHT family NTPase